MPGFGQMGTVGPVLVTEGTGRHRREATEAPRTDASADALGR